jgi:hypothetical protein
MCNQEDKENAGYEHFDNSNVAASLLLKIVSLQRQSRPTTEPCEFPENANILSSTSVYINEEFSKPTISICNQEDKENAGNENFDNANVAASLLMLFHCSSKESRLQEPCEFPESANILSSTSVYINEELHIFETNNLNVYLIKKTRKMRGMKILTMPMWRQVC